MKSTTHSKIFILTLTVFTLGGGLLPGCNGGGGTPGADPQHTQLPDTSGQDPTNPPVQTYATEVLLFNGTGVSTSDWQSTEAILQSEGLSYQLVNSAQMNALSLDQLASYGTIVVPGGSGGSIAGGLTNETQLRMRQAVQQKGTGYVGFCAGAWVAVGPEAGTTQIASYGLALAPGAVLDEFFPGGQEPTAAIVTTSFPDGSTRDLVWWGGPITPEWQNGVVARYDTGTPAISETFSGKGLVVISGPHPEAPEGWRATAGNDPDGLDYDLAVKMIRAAINKQPLPTF